MLYVKIKLKVSFERREQSVPKASGCAVNIIIDNPTLIPIPNCDIVIKYKTEFSDKAEKLTIHTPVFPHNSQILTVKFAYNHYGMLSLELAKVKIFDMLRIIRVRVKGNKGGVLRNTRLVVFPGYIPLESAIKDYSDLGLESENYSKSKKGDDPSEIFNIREYSEGDKISRIHWKLSAKQSELIVKDYSLPITNAVLLVPDLSHIEDNDTLLFRFDAVIDAISAISMRLAENEVTHTLLFPSDDPDGFRKYIIGDIESYSFAMKSLITSCFGSRIRSSCQLISEITQGAPKYAHLILCTTSLNDDERSQLVDSQYAYRYTAIVASDETGPGYTEDQFEYLPLPAGSIQETLDYIAI